MPPQSEQNSARGNGVQNAAARTRESISTPGRFAREESIPSVLRRRLDRQAGRKEGAAAPEQSADANARAEAEARRNARTQGLRGALRAAKAEASARAAKRAVSIKKAGALLRILLYTWIVPVGALFVGLCGIVFVAAGAQKVTVLGFEITADDALGVFTTPLAWMGVVDEKTAGISMFSVGTSMLFLALLVLFGYILGIALFLYLRNKSS